MNHSSSITAGLDLGDRYSHLCLIDTQSGEVIEEGRITTTPKALQRRFSSLEPMLIAIEAGTHSPWVSRLLKRLGHDVLVANARKLGLIYAEGARATGSTPRIWLVLPGWIRSCLAPLKHRGETSQAHLWRSFARARHSSKQEPSSSITSGE